MASSHRVDLCVSLSQVLNCQAKSFCVDHGLDENVYEKRASEQQQFIDVFPPSAGIGSGGHAGRRRHDLDARNAREDGEENRSVDEGESKRNFFFIIRK